ncbi:hypothetical protein GCM10025865_17880 [Paraoerskovia sediminicola]|uniref:Peptidase C-terminal archaeal/bacterial domain-containing protein n=1 Tax=Paraoerskovia sediminicola TaxID=1138587 RepID=A0ABM8G349_9CELL|nr:hypothetical protein [Paraoerskovia sediminicola]BDZ42489.1 hypothetical protein GCM10025865_17880 [Paraoerskovia sediminicola]
MTPLGTTAPSSGSTPPRTLARSHPGRAPRAARARRAPLAVLAAVALTATTSLTAVAAGPATALDANDLAPGDIVADQVVGDFTIKATSAKKVTVDGSDRTSDRGDVFTQRIKLNGSGTPGPDGNRAIELTVAEPAEVLLQARSGSGSSDRTLGVYDETGAEIDTVPALADDSGVPVATETVDIPAAGTYWIASTGSGINVYRAEILDGSPVDRAPWADVAAPTVDSVVVDPEDPATLLVGYTGLLSDDGADIAHATLYDDGGEVVDRAFVSADGTSGTIALSPPASGTYAVDVRLTRSGRTTPSSPSG